MPYAASRIFILVTLMAIITLPTKTTASPLSNAVGYDHYRTGAVARCSRPITGRPAYVIYVQTAAGLYVIQLANVGYLSERKYTIAALVGALKVGTRIKFPTAWHARKIQGDLFSRNKTGVLDPGEIDLVSTE